MDYTGLLFDCPIKEEVQYCPFNELRQLDLKERFEVWKKFSENERNKLISLHHVCIYEREKIKYKIDHLALIENELL